jgi:hypothetical protein
MKLEAEVELSPKRRRENPANTRLVGIAAQGINNRSSKSSNNFG